VLPLETGDHYFDSTTLALVRCARARVPEGARILDLGTGSSAALGLVLSREKHCRVTATEIDPRTAESARRAILRNHAPIQVHTTNLLEGIEGPFDLVIFNPPYVPTATGLARKLPGSRRTQWDGGADGTRTIAEFLDALRGRDDIARAMLGVNDRHVPPAVMEGLFADRAELECEEIVVHPWLPNRVYFLVSRKSPIASTSSPEA